MTSKATTEASPPKPLGQRVLDRFREPFRRVINLQGTPTQLSYSFGYGMFIGFLPGPGWPLVIATRFVVRVMNLPAAMAGALVSNPYTFIPLWTAGYWLGNQFLHRPLPEGKTLGEWAASVSGATNPGEVTTLLESWLQWHVFLDLVLPLFLGLGILSLLASVIATVLLRRVLEQRAAEPTGTTPLPSSGASTP